MPIEPNTYSFYTATTIPWAKSNTLAIANLLNCPWKANAGCMINLSSIGKYVALLVLKL
ncbi:hypothetical protein QUA42_01485 [Microcoleus sp. Pol11C2]|uniref:hypothetical protein n=1 Tax=Microcoleus sp. Pol11C2 TaxID=3055389 RepID=UPI002FD0449A